MIQRSVALWAAGTLIAVMWFGLALAGDRPDGAILGFAGTIFLIAGTSEKSNRQRRERRQRKPNPELEPEPDWEEKD